MVPGSPLGEAEPVATRTPTRSRKQANPLAAEDPDVLRGWFHRMVLVRRFEERASQGYTRA
jgi:pyruvate dehydrogenase E1 component alpha subunit